MRTERLFALTISFVLATSLLGCNTPTPETHYANPSFRDLAILCNNLAILISHAPNSGIDPQSDQFNQAVTACAADMDTYLEPQANRNHAFTAAEIGFKPIEAITNPSVWTTKDPKYDREGLIRIFSVKIEELMQHQLPGKPGIY